MGPFSFLSALLGYSAVATATHLGETPEERAKRQSEEDDQRRQNEEDERYRQRQRDEYERERVREAERQAQSMFGTS